MKHFFFALLALLSINFSTYGVTWGIGITNGQLVNSGNTTLAPTNEVSPTTDLRAVNTSLGLGAGSAPFGVAINPNNQFAYVTRQGTSGVAVIDLTNLRISTDFPTPNNDPTGIGHNPTQPKLYVTLKTGAEVQVFNSTSGTLLGGVGVGSGPTGVAFSPDGTRAYITNTLSNSISIINDTTLAVVGTIGGLSNPRGIVISPDGTKAYVANGGADEIAIVDLNTNTLLSPIPAGTNPDSVALSNDGNKLYVTNFESLNVQVFNPNTRQQLSGSPIALTANPQGIVLSNDNTNAYVTLFQSGRVALINTETNVVEKELPAGESPQGIGFVENGLLVVANEFGDSASIFFSETDAKVVEVGADPASSVGSIDGRVFMANQGSDTISVYDTNIQDIVATIKLPAGAMPTILALSRNSKHLFVANSGNGTVARIETASYSIERTYTFPGVTMGPTSVSCINDDDGKCTAFLATALNLGNILTQVDVATGETTELTLAGMPVSVSVAPSPNENGDTIYTTVDDSNTATWGSTCPNTQISSDATIDLGLAPIVNAVIVASIPPGAVNLTTCSSSAVPQPSITPPLDLEGLAFVTDSGNNVVIVLDLHHNQILTTIPVGIGPNSLAISAGGNFLYVTNGVSNTVSVIDLSTFQVVNTISTGLNPIGISTFPILPLNAEGNSGKNQFFTQTDYFNRIEWSPPLVTGIVDEYLIFTDQDLTDLIGTVPGSVFTFDDHSILKPTTRTYFIIGTLEGFATSSSLVTVEAN